MSEMERAKEIEEAVKAADPKKRADAEEAAMAGEKLDRILDCMDALGRRMDVFEAECAPAKKEEGEDEIEKGKPKELAADSQMVAADAEEIEDYKSRMAPLARLRPIVSLPKFKGEADRAASAWGKDAKHPWDGERITAYRRRVAREHQKYSPAWKGVDLSTLSGQSLRNATAQIYADSIAASAAPESYGETLVERRLRDPVSGQTRIEFYGSPSAWTNQFKGGGMRVKAFRTGGWKQD
jgi:hypothetical protein